MLRHGAANRLICQLKERLPVLADRLFPERQFFVRSRGRVRFLAVSQRVQMVLAALLAIGAIGAAVTALLPSAADDIVAAMDREIARLTAAYRQFDARLDDVSGHRDRALRANHRLSEQTKSLTATLAGSTRQRNRIAKQLRATREKLAKASAALKLANIKTQALTVKSAELDRRLTAADTDKTRAEDELHLMRRQLAGALA